MSPEIRQYAIVTGNYWAFTLTDGALRMLVVLYFHSLGYSPFSIAMLFLFYEFFGVVTNLVGGWLGARIGLNNTMNIGLGIQIAALAMLSVPTEWLSVALVMAAQALSGIAKDLNKMSAKSAVKHLVSHREQGKLFSWIAILTGSKNTLKGVGFFLGGILLTLIGFKAAMISMAVMLTAIWIFSFLSLKQDMGKAKSKPKFTDIFSKSDAINTLSAARLFLFGARDVWFVVAIPVYLATSHGWDYWSVGTFMASWVIGYGLVQSSAPRLTGTNKTEGVSPRSAIGWGALLTAIPILIAMGIQFPQISLYVLLIGLLVFGVVFAINSSLHSYLIVRLADADSVSLDVGFYYMANAMGRLMGTVLSGFVYQYYGLTACLIISSGMLLAATLISVRLPR